MSAARLAAETAFSFSRSPAADPLPTITVRRSRGFGAEAAHAQTAVDSGGEVAQGNDVKPPRTFRLDATAPQGIAAELRPALLAVSPLADAETLPGRRKRRIAAEQRPGPVVQVFKATTGQEAGGERAGEPVVAANAPALGITQAQLAALAGMLAGVEPLLDDIRRARAFRVMDSSFAGQWQDLSAAAEDIRRQIRRRASALSAT